MKKIQVVTAAGLQPLRIEADSFEVDPIGILRLYIDRADGFRSLKAIFKEWVSAMPVKEVDK